MVFGVDESRTVTPEEEGLDSQALADALLRVRDQDMHLHSLIIIRHGRRLLDIRLFPFGPDQTHGAASVTKSVTATLIAIALRLDYLKNLDQRLVDLLPGRTMANWSSGKEQITLEHLLTMSSGLQCVYQPTEVTLYEMRAASDWVQFALDLPMTDLPGSRFAYHSAACHLLSAVLQHATGRTTLEFAQQHLFGPLGFGSVEWQHDPQGYTDGWGHLRLLPQDMARLGQLYLHDGMWEGHRLLPEGWVMAATRRHLSAAPMGDGYGYLWWIPADGGYQALGLGGQSIVVRPDLDLVVVTNGSGRAPIVPMILSAVRSSTSLPANPLAWQELQAIAAQLTSSPGPGPVPSLPATAAAVSAETYALPPNVLGWTEMGLRFRQHWPEALLVCDDHELPVGLDGVPRTSADPDTGWPVALHGRWEGQDTFVLVYDTISQYRTYRLTLRFHKSGVSVTALEHSSNHETEFGGSVRR